MIRWQLGVMIGCSAWLIGCADREPTMPTRPIATAEPEGAPAVGDRVVWRPFVDTCAGRIDSADVQATAFFVADQSLRPALITARSLLTRSAGLDRDLTLSEASRCVQAAYVSDAFGASDAVRAIGSVVPFPTAQDGSVDDRWRRLGLIAFTPQGLDHQPLAPFRGPIHEGQRVWLITAVYGGAPPSQKCHQATIQSLGEEGELTYRFANSELSLQAAAGAPLLSDSGELVGVHLKRHDGADALRGSGVGGDRLWQSFADWLPLNP